MLCSNRDVDFSISTWSKLPAHLQLADRIRAAIDAGELKPGDAIPPPRELAISTGVGIAVVHSALRRLEREHLVYTVRGRGTYVTSRR
jgi:GntR family transcriptional regulator